MLHESPPVLPRVPGSLERIDIALAIWLASQRHHPAARVAAAVNAAGDQPPLLALSGAVLAFGLMSGDRRAAGAGRRMLASTMISIVIKTALKAAISRTRPNVLLDAGRYEVSLFGPNEGPRQSFPSGHVAGSVALARAVVRSYPNARRLAWAGAAAIALVQVPRGTHYPLDVVAGIVVGLVSDAIAERLESRTGRARRPRGV